MVVAVEEIPDHTTQPSLVGTHSDHRHFDHLAQQSLDSCCLMRSCPQGVRAGGDLESCAKHPCILTRVSFSPPLSRLHRAWTHQSCSPTIDLVLFPSIPSHLNRCQCSCSLSVTKPAHNHSTKLIRDGPELRRSDSVAIAVRFSGDTIFFLVATLPLLRRCRRHTEISIYLQRI